MKHKIALDLSYTWETLSGMAIDTLNLWRIFTHGDQTIPVPLVWDTKAKTNIYLLNQPITKFNHFIKDLGAPLTAKERLPIKLATMTHLILMALHLEPRAYLLTRYQKKQLFTRFFKRVLEKHLTRYLQQEWILINPPSNLFYELVKFKPAKILDKYLGIYKRRRLILPAKTDFVLYQYPRLLHIKGATHIIKVHDMYPLYMEEAVPEGSRTAQTRYWGLKKLVDDKWDVFITTPSEFSRQELVKMLPYFKNRSFVIYNNLQQYPLKDLPSRKEIYKFIQDKLVTSNRQFTKYLIQVGTLQPIKGHKLTLTAFKQIRIKHPDTILVFVGGYGWKAQTEKQEIERLVARGDAIWVKNIPTRILLGLIKHARALLQPSKVEGFGLPPLEALLVGTVPIVSDIPVFREVLHRDVAIFFKLEHLKSYIDSIELVLNDNNYVKIQHQIDSKRHIVLDRYTDETIYQNWIQHLNSLKGRHD